MNANPKLMHYGETSTANEQIQSELFAKFFATNFELSPTYAAGNSNASVLPTTDSSGGTTDLFKLDECFIFDELTKLDTSKGIGPDSIHPIFLKNCSAALSEPLAIIFNDSLALGRFPTQWKSYSVRPIFKKGTRSDVENYRCIAKLPTIATFFEKLFTIKLTGLIGHHIVPQQHGFMKHRSPTTNLMEFVHYIMRRGAKLMYSTLILKKRSIK